MGQSSKYVLVKTSVSIRCPRATARVNGISTASFPNKRDERWHCGIKITLDFLCQLKPGLSRDKITIDFFIRENWNGSRKRRGVLRPHRPAPPPLVSLFLHGPFAPSSFFSLIDHWRTLFSEAKSNVRHKCQLDRECASQFGGWMVFQLSNGACHSTQDTDQPRRPLRSAPSRPLRRSGIHFRFSLSRLGPGHYNDISGRLHLQTFPSPPNPYIFSTLLVVFEFFFSFFPFFFPLRFKFYSKLLPRTNAYFLFPSNYSRNIYS